MNGANVADRLSGLTPEQRALFELLRKKQAAAQAPPGPPPPAEVRRVSGPSGAGDWPLSFDQERLWRLHEENPLLASWNVDAGSRLTGDLDVSRLAAALHAVCRRHAAWRTVFPRAAGRPVQRVLPDLPPETSVIDLTALPAGLRDAVGMDVIYARTRAPYDLERGPLVRAALVRTGAREHLMLLGVHHLVTDWITYQFGSNEVAAFYAALGEGRAPDLPAPPVQYPDFVVWEREQLQDPERLAAYTDFWRRETAGFPLALDLPADRPRPPVQSQRGGMFRIHSGPERADRLRTLARREGATVFMALLAVYGALIHRLTGNQRIVIGSNSANRARPELATVFGLFLTQVPFATDVSGDPGFRELLARARRTAVAAYAYQNFPFSKLVEALAPAPDPSRNPVVQALLLVLEGQPESRMGDLETRGIALYDGNSRWDLMLGVYNFQDAGFAGPLEYNADVLEAATVSRFVELFYRILDAVAADPDVRLSQLPAFADTEREELIAGGTAVPEERVRQWVDQLVEPLRRLGIGPGARVALLLDPSPELEAAARAVRLAGGDCVAARPGDPEVRLAALLADARIHFLLHRGAVPAGLAPLGVCCADLAALEAAA